MTAPDAPNRHDDPLLPEALAALSLAVRRGAVASVAVAPRRGRRPSRRLAALGAVGVLATGTTVAANAPWRPALGDADRGRPRASTAPLPAAQRAALGALRRPQTDADRSAPVRAALRRLIAREHVGVHVDRVRLLSRDARSTAILVPVERSGTHDRGYPDATVPDALCVLLFTPDGGGEKCGSTADLRSGHLRTVGFGLVPDGVARVWLRARTGERIEAAVRDNFYALPVDLGTGRSDDPNLAAATARFHAIAGRPVHWVDAHGRRVAKERR